MTANEIIKKVEELGISVEDFARGEALNWEVFHALKDHEDMQGEDLDTYLVESKKDWSKRIPGYYDLYEKIMGKAMEVSGLGKVVEVEQVGGEGEGSHWHIVKHFVDHDVYIMTIGHYQSYHGTDFYNGYGKEVRPTQRTITEYV